MSNLGKKFLSREERQKYISDWRESGLSKKAFAENAGLKYYTFMSWFEPSVKPRKVKGFTRVQLPASEKVFAEVICAGKTIRFFESLPGEYFSKLLQ